LTSRCLDRFDGLPRFNRIAVENASRSTRLDDHDAEAVGDHVVEFSRDASSFVDSCLSCPLFSDGGASSLLALGFLYRSLASERVLANRPPTHEVPDDPSDD